jgi:transposase
VECLEWLDENANMQKINCFDEFGKSKGLKKLALELGYTFSTNIKLDELKSLIKDHPAFITSSKLEHLASEYGVKLKFCPKYHCELNPIEGLWCAMKRYARKYGDQTFEKMKKLLDEAREDFCKKEMVKGLLKRFWRAVIDYKAGQSYSYVMKTHFSGRYKAEITSHRRIS